MDRISEEQRRARAYIADSIAVDQFQSDVSKGKVPEGWRGTATDWFTENYASSKEASFIKAQDKAAQFEREKYQFERYNHDQDSIDDYFANNWRS